VRLEEGKGTSLIYKMRKVPSLVAFPFRQPQGPFPRRHAQRYSWNGIPQCRPTARRERGQAVLNPLQAVRAADPDEAVARPKQDSSEKPCASIRHSAVDVTDVRNATDC